MVAPKVSKIVQKQWMWPRERFFMTHPKMGVLAKKSFLGEQKQAVLSVSDPKGVG